MPCSPNGLITNTPVTEGEMAELWEQTPNVFERKERLASLRRFVESHIEPNPATDGTLDRTAGRLSDTALMMAIGAKEDLKRGSIDAIKLGLEDLKRCPARPR